MNKLLKGVCIVVGGYALSEFMFMCGQCRSIEILRKVYPDEIGEFMEYWNDDELIESITKKDKYRRAKLKVMRYLINISTEQ